MVEEYSKKVGGLRYYFIEVHTCHSSSFRFHLVVRDLLFICCHFGLDRCLLVHWDFHLGCYRWSRHHHLHICLVIRNRHLRVRQRSFVIHCRRLHRLHFARFTHFVARHLHQRDFHQQLARDFRFRLLSWKIEQDACKSGTLTFSWSFMLYLNSIGRRKQQRKSLECNSMGLLDLLHALEP